MNFQKDLQSDFQDHPDVSIHHKDLHVFYWKDCNVGQQLHILHLDLQTNEYELHVFH